MAVRSFIVWSTIVALLVTCFVTGGGIGLFSCHLIVCGMAVFHGSLALRKGPTSERWSLLFLISVVLTHLVPEFHYPSNWASDYCFVEDRYAIINCVARLIAAHFIASSSLAIQLLLRDRSEHLKNSPFAIWRCTSNIGSKSFFLIEGLGAFVVTMTALMNPTEGSLFLVCLVAIGLSTLPWTTIQSYTEFGWIGYYSIAVLCTVALPDFAWHLPRELIDRSYCWFVENASSSRRGVDVRLSNFESICIVVGKFSSAVLVATAYSLFDCQTRKHERQKASFMSARPRSRA